MEPVRNRETNDDTRAPGAAEAAGTTDPATARRFLEHLAAGTTEFKARAADRLAELP